MHCTVVRETLENRGVLGQLRARIRAEVFSALNDPTDSQPAVSRENFLINELIREYLDFNHYKYASSVLSAGLYTGLPWDGNSHGNGNGMGMGTVMNSHGNCGNSVGIFEADL